MLKGQLWDVLTAEAHQKDQQEKSIKKIDAVAREELKKFFQVAVTRQEDGKKTGMPTCYVDAFWHRLLKEPAQYGRFCTEAVGAYADHLPYNGEGVLEWVPDYEALFGKLPPIWFTDLDGILDEAMYAEYMETGSMRASWNCIPLSPLKEKELESCLS